MKPTKKKSDVLPPLRWSTSSAKIKIKLILLIVVFHLSRNFPTKFLKAKARWTAITLNDWIPEN